MSRSKHRKQTSGKQYTLTIQSLSNSGDGVARIDDKVVFVPYSVPGDQLLVEVTESKKSFSKAKIVEILVPSKDRLEAPCEYFGKCGGCDWQNMPYEVQLKWKKKGLVDVLQRIAKIENGSVVEDIIPCIKPFHYRNRIQVHQDSKGLFFKQKNSHHPVYIDKCLIASEEINSAFERAKQQNFKKMEIAETSKGVQFFSVDTKGNSSLGFRQVNWAQNQFLIEKCLNVFEKYQISSLADLYCGQGNWAIEVKKAFPQIECVGIEINPTNIEIAKSFETEGLRFIEGSVEQVYPNLEFTPEAIIIDPPRSGATPGLINTINKNKPSFVIYLSCHPATLARDIKEFCSTGWSLSEIVPVDMFPQTSHLETWCLLRSET